jgi:KaiC/GvpD/RAD55 family RecA-like ATPase
MGRQALNIALSYAGRVHDLVEGENPPKPSGIPGPIRDFLAEPSARSLLVKGSSGTGKTTFVLQLMEEVLPLETSVYLSTRVSDAALYSHFKWLEEKEWRESILDASKEMLRIMKATPSREELQEIAEKGEILAASKDFLKTLYPDTDPKRQVERTRLDSLCMDYTLSELEKLYDRLERKLPARCFVIVDSLEGLAERWEAPVTKIMSALQKDLVEGTNISVIAVIEGAGDNTLDFLVDGTVTLHRSELDAHAIREIEIHKLRGIPLRQSRWLFTLSGGHFRALAPLSSHFRPLKGPAKAVPDAQGAFSTGHPSLDAMLGGGIPSGSSMLLEVGAHVPNDVVGLITLPVAANFLLQHRGVLIVPEGGETADDYHRSYGGMVDEAIVNELMRVAEKVNPSRDQTKPYIVALEYQDALKDFGIWDKAARALHDRTGVGPLRLVGLETQESRFGEEALREVISLVSESVRADGGVLLSVAKPGLGGVPQRVANTSDIHLRLARVDNSFVLYGVEPETEIFYIDVDSSDGSSVGFVPVV